MGSRHWPWLGAAGLLLIAVGVWVSSRFSSPPPPQVEPERPQAQRPALPAPQVARPQPARPVVKTPAPAQPAAQPATPPDSTPQEYLPPVDEEPPLSDPFEPQGNQEGPIRTLVAVGDIQLGVVREASNIKDEAGLKRVLVRIGDDLQKRLQEQQEQGAPSLQEVLTSYRDELGKYMDGEVEIRGSGWMIGTEVGPPKPRERWWKPRPQ